MAARNSARSLAYCWQEADGIPQEVLSVLGQAPSLQGLTTILAIPEHQVPLPGGIRPSQNDVLALGETGNGLVSIAVEGKVSEPFGPTVGEWLKGASAGKKERLKFLCAELGLAFPPPGHVQYQLFHRTVSAILEAKRFRASDAAMVVHSFSPTNEWFEDYQAFLALFGLQAGVDEAVSLTTPERARPSSCLGAWVGEVLESLSPTTALLRRLSVHPPACHQACHRTSARLLSPWSRPCGD